MQLNPSENRRLKIVGIGILISGLILVVTAPLIPVFMIFIGRGAEKLNQRQWRRMGVLSGHFLDALQGLTTLKLFNLGAREARLIAPTPYPTDNVVIHAVLSLRVLVLIALPEPKGAAGKSKRN